MSLVTVYLDGGTKGRDKYFMSKPSICLQEKFSYLKVILNLSLKFDAGLTLTELEGLQQNAFAEGTKSNQQTQVNAYLMFCQQYNVSALPTTGPTLSRYAAWLAVSKRAKTVQTIRNYLSAVRTLSKLYGLQCPTPSTDGGLGLTVRGLAKKLGKNKRRMFPITKPILKRLIQPDCNILDLEGSE